MSPLPPHNLIFLSTMYLAIPVGYPEKKNTSSFLVIKHNHVEKQFRFLNYTQITLNEKEKKIGKEKEIGVW